MVHSKYTEEKIMFSQRKKGLINTFFLDRYGRIDI